MPLKAIGNSVLRFGDVGHAEDSSAIQYNIVRVDGQKSVYLPILKQGGNSNTIQIVNGVRDRIKNLLDVPKSLVATVVFDQSQYVKTAVANVLREGGIGLVLTAVMILIFLGSVRGTISVLLSIPISCLAAFLLLNATGSTINTMVLGGLALVLLALIDNSVVVLENIFRHLEEGEDAVTAAERGGQEVQLAVLAATFTTAIVFLPGRVSVRRQPLSVHRVGAGRGAGIGRLVPGGHDAGAAVLRSLHQDGAWPGWTSLEILFGRFVSGFNHKYDQLLLQLRSRRGQGADPPGGHDPDHHGDLRRQPGAVSVARRRLLPADRSGPVRDQYESSYRLASGDDQPLCRARRKRHSRRHRQGRSADDRLQHRPDAGSVLHLHQQFRPAHGLRASQSAAKITS